MLFGKHINRYYLRYGWLLLVGVLLLLLEDSMMLMLPEKYQLVVNGLTAGVVEHQGETMTFDMAFLLDQVCMPMLKIILIMLFGRFLWRFFFFGFSVHVTSQLRNRMFSNARFLSAEFYSRNKVGNLMSLFTNDLTTINECLGHGTVMTADAVIIGVMALWKMFRMNVPLTLLSMLPMGLLITIAVLMGRHMTKKWKVRQEAYSRLADFAQERISGISVVKAFVKEAVEMMSFQKLNRENEEANVAHTKASVLMRVLVTLFIQSVVAVIFGFGGYLVYKGEFNAGQIVEFYAYFNNIIYPVMAVSELIDLVSRGKASQTRIEELLDAKPDVVDAVDAKPMPEIKGEIRVENLSFRYPDGEKNVLQDISFTIKAGEKVGIVGKTGAGKTTLVDLLLRTYNVPDGTVFIDGEDINSVKLHDLREGFAYVPQDNFLFSDTIENNIAFGVNTPENARNAAVLADVDENIQGFPQGYATVLGERGVTVSGGQKQRISIARALLKDAPVLIMDDSVSAVDTATEKTILSNLHRERQGKTTIVIAHRISTVEAMDKILFLEDGCLVAQGSHQALLDTCPGYRKLSLLQRLSEEGGSLNG
ncbi:MAG: ABC transporter ATP-binding protein [Oscillospiraceae bacterium]|nr:ABC transporter ATP-binding protein [Oscillospiraceae bacterium]